VTRRGFADPIRPAPPGAGAPVRPRAALPRLVHGLLLACSFVAFAYRFALPIGLAAGALASLAGVLAAERLVIARYRLPIIVAGAWSAFGVGWLVVSGLVSSEAVASILSPARTLVVADMLFWAVLAAAASVSIRAIAIRHRATLAIEGSIVALAAATTVAAHRDGMIARPLEISDWFWTQGIDPVAAFLGVGLAAAVLLAGIFAYGRAASLRGASALEPPFTDPFADADPIGSADPIGRRRSRRDRTFGARSLLPLLVVLLLGVLMALRIHSRDTDLERKNAIGEKEGDGSKDSGSGAGAGEGFQDDLPKSGESKRNKPAAIVVFHKDAHPFGDVFYFRHAAFSQFNGIRLIEASRLDVDPEARNAFPAVDQEVLGPQRDREGRTAVATDVAMITQHNRMFALIDPIEVGPLPNPDTARFVRAYRVVSNVLEVDVAEILGDAPGDPSWSDEVWEHYTELPKDERYHRLAADIQRSLRAEYAADPVARALAIKAYLEKEATYSFARSYDGAEDPTAEFLFSEDKRGYCVHLAHAAAYLLRALGVPARVSAGYAVPAENLAGGSALLIKQGDAHAWAEIYLEDHGWVPIEVSPEKSDVPIQQFEEKDLQQLLGEMARKEGRHERQTYQGPKLSEIIAEIGRAIPYLALAALIAAYVIKLWRLAAPVFATGRSRPRLTYRAALDRLSASGLFRTRGEPRERFARRVADVAPSFVPLTWALVASALRPAGPACPRGNLPSLARQVGGEVRRSVPLWRWLLGLSNPISWLWSR
jgi:hypothetical protein